MSGALAVCQEVVDLSKKRKISSHLVDDKTAVECCVLFLRDHQLLVEPACGATLAAVYSGKVKLKVNAGKAKRNIKNGTVNTKNNKILLS